MGHVQNGRLYIIIGIAPWQQSKRIRNTYELHPLAILLLIYSIGSTNLYLGWKTKREYFSFVHFLSFFNERNSKTIWCKQIIYIPNNCSATGHLPFLVWGGVQTTTGELRPQNWLWRHFTCLVVYFWGFCSIIPGVACINRPHPDYWTRATWVSRSSTIVFSIYLALKTNSVKWKTLLYIYIPFGAPQCDSARFWGKYCSCDYGNHLDKFCLEVAGSYMWLCVCMWLKLKCVLSTRLSPILKCSPPVWNAFISSGKSICP